MQLERAGSLRSRAVLGITALLAVIAGAGLAASILGPPPQVRPPELRHSSVPAAPADLLLDSSLPKEPVSLLFFQGRPTVAGAGDRRAVVSEAGTVLASDSLLRVWPVTLALGGSSVLGAAPAEDGGWWISTVDGELLRVDAGGVVTLRSPAPFPAAALWPDAAAHGIVATRSPERFSFLPESADNPVVATLDAQGRPQQGRGTLVVPQHSLLATLANVGYAVATGDTVFFAPLSRPEVVALDSRGDTIWISRAEDVPPTPEPRIRLADGHVRIDYQPLNLGLTLGPDGRLYVLRATDTAVSRVRLDVLERTTGRVRWRAQLNGPRGTLAANRLGRVYTLDENRLLGAIPPAAREPLPEFDLPRLGGGRASLQEHLGRVMLINVWASWCTPCRTEMPALDTLQKALRGEGFAFLALSEDENRGAAERFARERSFEFPVLFGDGRLKSRYHYPGLPITILVDRSGRIVRRWFGELQPSDYQLIRTLVRSELGSGAPDTTAPGPQVSHHHHVGP
jgi:thiol-disulfide isomerase/thioredoxin